MMTTSHRPAAVKVTVGVQSRPYQVSVGRRRSSQVNEPLQLWMAGFGERERAVKATFWTS